MGIVPRNFQATHANPKLSMAVWGPFSEELPGETNLRVKSFPKETKTCFTHSKGSRIWPEPPDIEIEEMVCEACDDTSPHFELDGIASDDDSMEVEGKAAHIELDGIASDVNELVSIPIDPDIDIEDCKEPEHMHVHRDGHLEKNNQLFRNSWRKQADFQEQLQELWAKTKLPELQELLQNTNRVYALPKIQVLGSYVHGSNLYIVPSSVVVRT